MDGIHIVRYELTHEDVLILIQPLPDDQDNILGCYRDLSALCFHLYHIQIVAIKYYDGV